MVISYEKKPIYWNEFGMFHRCPCFMRIARKPYTALTESLSEPAREVPYHEIFSMKPPYHEVFSMKPPCSLLQSLLDVGMESIYQTSRMKGLSGKVLYRTKSAWLTRYLAHHLCPMFICITCCPQNVEILARQTDRVVSALQPTWLIGLGRTRTRDQPVSRRKGYPDRFRGSPPRSSVDAMPDIIVLSIPCQVVGAILGGEGGG